MKIIYPYPFRKDEKFGGLVHILQFIYNIEGLGHQVITRMGDPQRNDPGLLNGKFQVLKLIRSSDVLYFRVENRAPYARGYQYRSIYKKLLGNPIIVWEVNTVPEFGKLFGRDDQQIKEEKQRFGRIAESCDLAICVSESIEDYVKEVFGIQRAITVPNGSDPDVFRPDIKPANRIRQAEDILNVVWIGSANMPWHDFDTVKRTARLLCQKGYESQVLFHIIGAGMVSMADMPVNVSYYGSQPYEKLPKWLAAMDVGLILYQEGPAFYGSPLKLFDYMASGLTIVASSQPQVDKILKQLNQNDMIIPCRDEEKLAEKLIWLQQHKEKLAQYGQMARKLLVEKYTWKHNAKRIMEEIKSLSV